MKDSKLNEKEMKNNMVLRDLKSEALQEKYQLLRSATNSKAANKASILVDACKYIQELQRKVERLNQDTSSGCSNQPSTSSKTTTEVDHKSLLPKVSVEILTRRFLINVFSERNCSALLVSILGALEGLGLEVLDATVSSTDCIQLQAVWEENGVENPKAELVRQAVSQAIMNRIGST